MKFLVLNTLFFVFCYSNSIIAIPTSSQESIWYFGHASKKSLPQKRLKILIWNIFKGQKLTFLKEFNDLAFDKDLILVQELLFDKKMERAISFLPHFQGALATTFYVGKEQNPTGVATLSSVKSIYIQAILTEITEPITSTPKATLLTKYPIENTTSMLTVINTHGINFVTNRNFKIELERIKKIIEEIDGPILLAGDFNTWNQERMVDLEKMTTTLNLISASFSPDFRKTWNDYPLDHFFHSRHFKIIKAKADQTYDGSDHQPLVLEIEFNSQSLK